MLRIASEVNDVEDRRRTAKIDRAQAKQNFEVERDDKKKARKDKSKALREQSLATAKKREREDNGDANPNSQKRRRPTGNK